MYSISTLLELQLQWSLYMQKDRITNLRWWEEFSKVNKELNSLFWFSKQLVIAKSCQFQADQSTLRIIAQSFVVRDSESVPAGLLRVEVLRVVPWSPSYHCVLGSIFRKSWDILFWNRAWSEQNSVRIVRNNTFGLAESQSLVVNHEELGKNNCVSSRSKKSSSGKGKLFSFLFHNFNLI